jgi:indole-3-glycerol phosphate synthase
MISTARLTLVLCAVVVQATFVGAFAPLPGLHALAKRHGTLEIEGWQPRSSRTANFCMQETASMRWGSDAIAKRRVAELSVKLGSKTGGKKKLEKFMKTLKKPSGTIAVIGEIKRKDPNDSDFGVKMPDAAECSKAFHDSKVRNHSGAWPSCFADPDSCAQMAAIAVWVDEELYGCSVEDLRKVVAAQASFKGEFPGPCPVLACGVFVRPEQVVQAADAGAAAVLLSASVLGAELANMIESASAAGVESVC